MKKTKEDTTVTLKRNEWFTLSEADPKSLFYQVNIHLKNMGDNLVKVTSDKNSILIAIEKPKE